MKFPHLLALRCGCLVVCSCWDPVDVVLGVVDKAVTVTIVTRSIYDVVVILQAIIHWLCCFTKIHCSWCLPKMEGILLSGPMFWVCLRQWKFVRQI